MWYLLPLFGQAPLTGDCGWLRSVVNMTQWGLLLDSPMWGRSTFYVWETICAEIQCVGLKTNRRASKTFQSQTNVYSRYQAGKDITYALCSDIATVFCFSSSANSHPPWLALKLQSTDQRSITFNSMEDIRLDVSIVFSIVCLCVPVCVCVLPWTRWSVFGAGQAQGAWTSGYTQESLLFLHPGQR